MTFSFENCGMAQSINLEINAPGKEPTEEEIDNLPIIWVLGKNEMLIYVSFYENVTEIRFG